MLVSFQPSPLFLPIFSRSRHRGVEGLTLYAGGGGGGEGGEERKEQRRWDAWEVIGGDTITPEMMKHVMVCQAMCSVASTSYV